MISKCTKEECSLPAPMVMKRDRPHMHTVSSATEWLNLDCFLGLWLDTRVTPCLNVLLTLMLKSVTNRLTFGFSVWSG